MPEFMSNGSFWVFASLALIVCVPSVAYFWCEARKAECQAMLKRDMIARGMSPEEIERVIRAEEPTNVHVSGT